MNTRKSAVLFAIGAVVAATAGCSSTGSTGRRSDSDPASSGGTPSAGGASFILGDDACPEKLPDNGTPCRISSRPPCSYRGNCDAGGACTAECIAGAWFATCEPCSEPPVCPDVVPVHGSPCDGAVAYTCKFESCEVDGMFLAARCEGGSWSVDSRICHNMPCMGGEDDFGCAPGQACLSGPACLGHGHGHCIDNPCRTNPFSCTCAGVTCPADSACESADQGRITCKELPHPDDPTIFVDGLNLAGPLVLFDDTLFAATSSPVPVVAIDAATAITRRIGETGAYSHDLAVDADGVYWLEVLGIRSAPLSGTATTKLFEAQGTERLALDATHVYFTTDGNSIPNPNTIQRVAKKGGGTEVLAHPVMPAGIAVDQTAVYFADRNNATNFGLIQSVAPTGGATRTLATEQGFPSSLAVDDNRVFWLDEWAPGVKSLSKAGGTITSLYSGTAGMGTPKSIALDSESVYFTQDDGKILKLPIGGGDPVVLATRQIGASGIAVDAKYAYWTVTLAGCSRILRAPK